MSACDEGREPHRFWAALGGRGEYPAAALCDVLGELPPPSPPRLFQLCRPRAEEWSRNPSRESGFCDALGRLEEVIRFEQAAPR